MTCVQCGHPHPTLLRRRPRPARYSCRSCGAVFRTPPADAPEPERYPPTDGDPLAEFMPARMVRWVREGQPVSDTPDQATLGRWYKDFDALVAKTRSSADARAVVERVSEIPADLLPARLPAFSKVCTALHTTCYDSELAAARLTGSDPEFVAERVGHLRRWLGTAGRSTTWLEARADAEPAPEAVKELLTGFDSLTVDQMRTFSAALFGVNRGPSVRGVRDHFGEERVRHALLAYLETGARPLREAVRDELVAK